MGQKTRLFIASTGVALAVAASGCGPSGSDPEAASTASVAAATTDATDATAPTTTSAGAGSITQNFAVTNPNIAKSLPPFVQLPDGTRVQMHMPFSNDLRKGGTLLAITPMPQAAVVDFHRMLMSRNGLIPQPDAVGTKGEIILLARSTDEKSEYAVRVFPTKPQDGTVIQVNYFEAND